MNIRARFIKDTINTLNEINTDSEEESIALEAGIKELEKRYLEETEIGMFCPGCRSGVRKHIYGANNKAFKVKYCPFCGEKLDWGESDTDKYIDEMVLISGVNAAIKAATELIEEHVVEKVVFHYSGLQYTIKPGIIEVEDD